MTFSFLNPLFWLGALAVAAPVWLHLRRKRTTKLVPFSALRFLEDQPEPRRSPLRLRDLALLALRVATLLLLVSAFAWPYWNEPIPERATESRVYILDNTLSHQAGDGSRRDRDRLREEIARLGPETQAAVIELAAQPRVVVSFGDDRAAALLALGELPLSHQRGSYLAAFRTAQALLAHSLGRKKTIVLLGDSQENQWTENAGAPPFLPEDVAVTLPEVPQAAQPNLSLANPRLQRVLLGDRALIDFAVDLDHLGPAESVTLTIRANGEEILRREVSVVDQPGTLSLGTQWETDPRRGVEGEVSVSGQPDALEADNRVYFALPPVTEGKVVLLAESPYLRTALSPEVMRGRWATRLVEPAQLADELAANHDADVLCVESHFLQSAKGRELVLRYLSSGRGVFLLLDRDSPLVHGFLRELGFELQGESAAATTFRYVSGDHPIFHPFQSLDFGTLSEIQVARHRRVQSSRALPLVFAEGGDVLFFQGATTRGKLFLCTFGFDRKETDWPVHPTFLPFLDLCLQNARAQDELPTRFEPGELAVVSLPGERPSGAVVLRRGDKELAREPIKNGRVQLRLPDAPGLYTVVGLGAPDEERTVSVNPSPRESSLTYLQAQGIVKGWQFDPALAPQSKNAVATVELSRSSILQQRSWWWLLLIGLAACLGESAWLASPRGRLHEHVRSGRRTPAEPGGEPLEMAAVLSARGDLRRGCARPVAPRGSGPSPRLAAGGDRSGQPGHGDHRHAARRDGADAGRGGLASGTGAARPRLGASPRAVARPAQHAGLPGNGEGNTRLGVIRREDQGPDAQRPGAAVVVVRSLFGPSGAWSRACLRRAPGGDGPVLRPLSTLGAASRGPATARSAARAAAGAAAARERGREGRLSWGEVRITRQTVPPDFSR